MGFMDNMKSGAFTQVRKLEWLFFLALGAAGSVIFPPYVSAWKGYAALIVFFAMLLANPISKLKLFMRGYIFGFAFYAAGFVWINNALLTDNNRFAAFIPLAFLATGLFFGLFWAFPALISAWGKNIYSRALLLCGAFVFFEWVRSFIFTGFPWNLLGTALGFEPKLLQVAAYIGGYGLSVLLMLFLCGAAMLVAGLMQKRFYAGALLFLIGPLLVLFWGAGKYQISERGGMTVRLVQPSIPQTFKWQADMVYKNFRQYIDLSTSRPLDNINLVVWGETASPYFLDMDPEHLQEITEAIPDKGFLITGLLRAGMEKGHFVPYNSLFVINKDGHIKDYYDKAHLVPFGEYLPLREYLPDFMTPVANVVGDLGRGEALKNISVDGLPLMGGAICYESIFPGKVLNRAHKPEVLLVLANDGWYGVSAGPAQHLAAAQLRAVEEGVTVIRSANTGISAVVTPHGDIIGRLELNEIGVSDVVLPKRMAHRTFYGAYGNIVPLFLVLGVLLLGFVLNRLRAENKENSNIGCKIR